MAKASQSGFVDQHIEKIVLGASALFLLIALLYWGISSPREIQMPGMGGAQAVKPGDADRQLAETDRWVRNQIDKAVSAPHVSADLLARSVTLQQQPLAGLQAPVVAMGNPMPEITLPGPLKSGEKVALAQLTAALPIPRKPVVHVARELPRKGDTPTDVVAAHVVSVFSWNELTSQWSEVLNATRVPMSAVAVGVEAQVRELGPDGKWSEPRAVQVARIEAMDNQNRVIQPPVVPNFDGGNGEEIRRAIQLLGQGWQEYLLQPPYWDILWPTQQWGSWRIHLPANPISDAAAKAAAVEGTPASPRPAVVATPRPGGPPEGMAPEGAPPEGAYAPPETPGNVPAPRPSPSARPAAPAAPAETVAAPEVRLVPPFEDQKAAGRILVWFHDTSLESAKVYQYRLRLVLVNPLVGFTGEVKNPADARVATLATDFSEWSDRVSVPKATEFFLVGGASQMRQVKVEIFTRSHGQWVKHVTTVAEGEPIGSTAEVMVTNPADGQRIRVPVDFSTGAVAAALDFERKVPKGSFTKNTIEMLYVDDKGKASFRVQLFDEESERYKQLRKDAR